MFKSQYTARAMPFPVFLALIMLISLVCYSPAQADETEIIEEEDETSAKEHKAERFVMPMTQWLERQAHDSRVLNPAAERIKAKPNSERPQLLRIAIREALQQFPGTVLSAVKETEEDDQTYFKIKILSATGTIKEVQVSSAELSELNEE